MIAWICSQLDHGVRLHHDRKERHRYTCLCGHVQFVVGISNGAEGTYWIGELVIR